MHCFFILTNVNHTSIDHPANGIEYNKCVLK